MREFRIKVNNEKTYVVKANDYNQAVKTLHSKLRDNAVSDSISRYTGEDAIRTNGFVKIKEDGDWTSYKYNGSDFDSAVFKIHQYNPSLIAFVSNGNRTITVRNKYLKDSSITDTDMKTAEDIIKKYGGNPVGNVMGLQKTRFVGQDEIKNQHDFAIDLDKAGYKFYLINSRYRISPKDSSIKDVSYVSGKNLKIGQKIVEDGKVLEVIDIKETQRGVNNNYRDVTLKNVKTGATETVHFVNSALARLNDNSPKYSKGQKIQTSAGIFEIMGNDPVRADVHTNRIEYSYRLKTPNGTYTNMPDWQLEELVKLGRYKLIDSNISDRLIESGSKKALSKNITTEIKAGKDPKQAAAIAYSVQRENDSNITDADPVKVEKIIRKEKSALGITYYLFQTKSNSGATIYFEVTDKTYHGEPTYSGGGIVSFSLKTANDSLDSHLLSDKLKAKYGEKEGTKRFLSGENDGAIKDSANITELTKKAKQLKNKLKKEKAHSYENWGQAEIRQLKDLFDYNNYSQSTKIINEFINWVDERTPGKIGDSNPNNIKNRKSYTIKVGDKQYKVFAESESEAINKYIKSKKQ